MPASASPEPAATPRRLRLESIALDHRGGDGTLFRALDIEALSVEAGERVGVRGPSGSGKTSLLHVISGLLSPGRGDVFWGDLALSRLSAAARDRWRRETIGFVFQDFHLIPELDVLANITLPATFAGWRIDAATRRRAVDLAGRMGLTDLRRRASVLSRGEQQRVAIARAVLNRPALILADEPTASLDSVQAGAVAGLLIDAAAQTGATLVCVSHDERLLARMERIVEIGSVS